MRGGVESRQFSVFVVTACKVGGHSTALQLCENLLRMHTPTFVS